jgi:hypothetical protein
LIWAMPVDIVATHVRIVGAYAGRRAAEPTNRVSFQTNRSSIGTGRRYARPLSTPEACGPGEEQGPNRL